MSFDIAAHCTDKAWLDSLAHKLDTKLRYAVQKANEVDYIPYTTENGQWKPNRITWWTNGFWPATMWQMLRLTGDSFYRDEAVRAEVMLDDALRSFKTLDHDAGFMWLIHSGVHHALEHNEDSYDRTLFAAMSMASRFNPSGFIRAWNGQGNEGWAIVDCMMNLPLLYWASEKTGDPRYRKIAMLHADTTMRCFVREDGSCNHIVCFDPETGDFLDNPGGQGYCSGSSWSRGQAWALYGFTLSYMLSGKAEYLQTAKRVAHYFIANIPADGVPQCDFRQPPEPDLKDNAAGAIAASGLLELARQVPQQEARIYFDAALRLLHAMDERCANWQNTDPGLLTQCTVAYHEESGRHITMNYADFFFIEAIGKLRGETLLAWIPQRFQGE